MKQKGKRKLAWLLAFTVAFSSSSFTVMAEDWTETEMQEAITEDAATTESPEEEVQDSQSVETAQDTEETENTDAEDEIFPEEETELAEDADQEEISSESEEDLFSSGDGETSSYEERYFFPEDEEILVGWDYHVDKKYEFYVENDENPEGYYGEAEIIELNVSNEESDEDESPVCSWEADGENGWNLKAERLGTAVVSYKYIDAYEKEQTGEFRIYVIGDKYTLKMVYPESGPFMLKNEQKTVSVELTHQWYHNDDDQGEEISEDWKLELVPDEYGDLYDDRFFDIKIENHDLIINSKDVSGGCALTTKASVKNEDGQWEEVAQCRYGMEVTEGYYMFLPYRFENIQPGEVLDLNNCGLTARWVEEGKEPVEAKNVSFEAEYDDNQWEDLNTDEDKLPILKRLTGDGCWLGIYLKDPEGNYYYYRDYNFAYVDYSVWFDDLRDEDNWTHLYKGEEYNLHLNTDNLSGKKNADIQWSVGYRTDENKNGNEDFSEDIPEDVVFWENKGDSDITLSAEQLEKAYEWLYETKGTDYWFIIKVRVMAGDSEVAYTEAHLRTVEDTELNYDPPCYDRGVIPGEKIWIEDHFYCYMRDGEHPYGEDVPVPITKLKVLDTDVVRMIQQSNGWILVPQKEGETVVGLTYKDFSGKEKTEFFNIYINDTVYYIEYKYEDGVGDMVPGSQKKIIPQVYYKDQKHPKGASIEKGSYTLEIPEEEYNKDVIQSVDVDEEGNIIVTAQDVRDAGSNICVRALSKETDEGGEPLWQAEGNIDVYVADSQWLGVRVLLKEDINENPKAGETIDLNKYGPYVVAHNGDTGQWQLVEDNIRFRLEYDDTVWKPTEETKNDEIPVMIRIANQNTDLRLVVEEKYYDSRSHTEQWQEITSASWGFETWAVCSHKWSKYKVTKAATVLAEGKETRTCELCGETETRKTAKLKATIKVAATSLPLQKGRSVVVKVSGLGKGDYVKTVTSAKSSSLKAARTSDGVKLTARKTSGKIKVTVITAGGARKNITVTLQSKKVATARISGISKNYTLKKGKTLTLKPLLTPITSQEKVTYVSSNSKIAKIDSKGKIRALKPGKAVITVKSGKKSVKCTIKVTK